jgi:uncharacterized OsmC-like protein
MTVINGVDTDALEATVAAVAGDSTLGEVTFSVAGTWADGFRLDSATGALSQGGVRDDSRIERFTLSSDEPMALLGSDTAVSPGEYLAQALAGCYTVTLAANAAALGIELEKMKIDIEIDFDLRGFLGLETDAPVGASEVRAMVTLAAPNSSEQEVKELMGLLEARSPIRDTLMRSVNVVTSMRTSAEFSS